MYNYHSHTNFCDGTSDPEIYLIQAIEKKFKVYGFSSHAPVPFDCKWCMKAERLEDYKAKIVELKSKYSRQLEVYISLEIDYIPGILSPHHPLIKAAGLDYTIGSVHFVEQFSNGRGWEIDGPQNLFSEGLEQIFKGKIKDAVVRYFELTREMLENSCPDILGHMDKIKMNNSTLHLFDENEKWYKEEIEKTLKKAKASGVVIEVNTRGIYKKKCASTYPGAFALERIRSLDIPVMINSDAHHPDEIDGEFRFAYETLFRMGFQNVKVFKEEKWQDAQIRNIINSLK